MYKKLLVNQNIKQPVFDIPEGTYNKTQILEISYKGNGKFPIYYSLDESFPSLKYWGPIAINQSCNVKAFMMIGNTRSEISEVKITIEKIYERSKGSVVIIGGAEHCKEIHEKIINLAGGPEKSRVVFMPASSAEPYEAGLDRVKRFSELGGLKIDYSKVPLFEEGDHDFSSIDNESSFWILPDALIDDENRPHLDESLWRNNGFSKEYALKLRDGGYNVLFLTGGNQARYMKCLYYPDGTEGPILTILKEIVSERGGVIAGTSAGGAFLSNIMILGGNSIGAMREGVYYEDVILHDFFDTYQPFKNKLWLGTGAGILEYRIVSDTHFIARGRFGRLISACLYLTKQTGRSRIGIGVDEDTALVAYGDYSSEVVGASGVLIIDTSEVDLTNITIENGNYLVNNVKVHYLENHDKVYLDRGSKGTGSIRAEISRTENVIPKNVNDKFLFHADIYGKNRLQDWLKDNFICTEATDTIGFQLIDNFDDSANFFFDYYDVENETDFEIFKNNNDLVNTGTSIVRFRKEEDTKAYLGKRSYQWWGSGDSNYPDLEHVQEDGYSIKNLYLDIIPLQLFNFPDLTDANDIPLPDLRDSERQKEEWNSYFEKYKRYYYAAVLIPTTESDKIEIRTICFEYAYHDQSRERKYTPPRLVRTLKDLTAHKRHDLDIVQIKAQPNSQIFLNEEKISESTMFGKSIIEINSKIRQIKISFNDDIYSENIVFENIEFPISKALMKFSEKSMSSKNDDY